MNVKEGLIFRILVIILVVVLGAGFTARNAIYFKTNREYDPTAFGPAGDKETLERRFAQRAEADEILGNTSMVFYFGSCALVVAFLIGGRWRVTHWRILIDMALVTAAAVLPTAIFALIDASGYDDWGTYMHNVWDFLFYFALISAAAFIVNATKRTRPKSEGPYVPFW